MDILKYEVTYAIKKHKKTMIVNADSKASAMSQVSQKTGGEIILVKQAKETRQEAFDKKLNLIKNTLFRSSIKTSDLIVIFKQIAVMVKAGMSITDSLREATNATKNKRLKEIIEDCVLQIEAGKTFNEALSKYESEIGNLSLSIIRMGEETGNLDEALYDLNRILEEMAYNKKKIKKAMKQPVITIVALIFAMIGLIVGVIPKFKTIFEGLGSELPSITQFLLALSDFFINYGGQLIGGLILLVFVHIKSVKLFPSYAFAVDKFKLKIPIIGTVIKYGLLARFLNVFNKLFLAGVSMTQAIDTAINTVDNLALREILEDIKYNMSKGESLSAILKETGLFVNMDIQMIKAGEEAGDLAPMLSSVSNRYKDEFDEIVDNLSSLIEPILLAVVAGMVLVLALGIFLPMWDLASAAKNH